MTRKILYTFLWRIAMLRVLMDSKFNFKKLELYSKSQTTYNYYIKHEYFNIYCLMYVYVHIVHSTHVPVYPQIN